MIENLTPEQEAIKKLEAELHNYKQSLNIDVDDNEL